MNFSRLLLLSSVGLGLTISATTALATDLIIGVPIGWKMVAQIALVVLAVAPVVYFLSRFVSRKIAKIITDIEYRLGQVGRHEFEIFPENSSIKEIEHIQKTINALTGELEKSIQNLKKQNSEKEVMLYSIAHDFRTPLTIIKGYIEEFQDNLVPEEKAGGRFATMQKEVDFLDELISSIIQFLESYQNKKTREQIGLKALLYADVLPILPIKKEVAIAIDLDDEIMMSFDRLELRKVFFNLLNNAVRFTDKGIVKVYAEEHAIVIEDTGCGIGEDEREKIFEPFYTMDKSRNKNKSGVGLGLSIVKNLLEKNGYMIRLDNKYTLGARFLIEKTL